MFIHIKMMTVKNKWTTEIRPKTGWFDIDVRELWRYRDLVVLFVRRDFVQFYKQTILGPLWFFLQPLFTTVVFTVVFGSIARIPTDGVPPMLFYLAGTVTWTYFSTCLIKTSDTFISNAAIFSKVYFPRLCVPISIVITNLIAFGLQFLFFVGFIVYYRILGVAFVVSYEVLLLPLLVVLMGALGLGLGIIVSALTTKYRDLRMVVQFGVQLFMYATPVVYPISEVPKKYETLLLLNPMTAIVESFRYALLGAGSFSWSWLGLSAFITFAILLIGVILFSRVEKSFIDTV